MAFGFVFFLWLCDPSTAPGWLEWCVAIAIGAWWFCDDRQAPEMPPIDPESTELR
jgi:hypothetical protein